MLRNRRSKEAAAAEADRVSERLRQVGASKTHGDSDPAVVERRLRNLSFGRSGA